MTTMLKPADDPVLHLAGRSAELAIASGRALIKGEGTERQRTVNLGVFAVSLFALGYAAHRLMEQGAATPRWPGDVRSNPTEPPRMWGANIREVYPPTLALEHGHCPRGCAVEHGQHAYTDEHGYGCPKEGKR